MFSENFQKSLFQHIDPGKTFWYVTYIFKFVFKKQPRRSTKLDEYKKSTYAISQRSHVCTYENTVWWFTDEKIIKYFKYCLFDDIFSDSWQISLHLRAQILVEPVSVHLNLPHLVLCFGQWYFVYFQLLLRPKDYSEFWNGSEMIILTAFENQIFLLPRIFIINFD